MNTNLKGFTFIELLAVVGVIGVLVGIVLVVLDPNTSRAKGRDAQRVRDITAMQAALEQYYADNGGYPYSGTGGAICVSSNWEKITSTPSGPNNSCLTEQLVTGGYLTGLNLDPKAASLELATPDNPCTASPSGDARYRYNYKVGYFVTSGAVAGKYGKYMLTAIMERPSSATGHECANLKNWVTDTGTNFKIGGCVSPAVPLTGCYGVENP